ncbi:AMP-binding protein [Caenimonas koreensis DSM 17982]|uniref:AMP-binding protein n=1 Tax=Caenimonas koreensis DSM 17982 TaxID=1121255 RepID=A0A844AZI8_9BURK|nr:AMP-binding protein [Caenimonas koreensis]MRD49755.1 AMP-binding protein [Caenimonas koreensis DSM 17982]
MNIFLMLDRTARRWPDAPAVYFGRERVQSWHDLWRRSLCLAAALRERCVSHSRVAIVTENAPQYLEVMFGTWAAEGAIVPVNYKLHSKEAARIFEDAEPSLVIASERLAPAIRKECGSRQVVTIGSPEYEDLFSRAPADVPSTAPDQLAWLFFTSGTTGRSKGAMLSHRNLVALTLAHLADVEKLDESCSQIHAAPMSHGSGLYIPAYVASGARQVIATASSFDAEEFLALCGFHPGCGAFLAPTMVQRLRLAAQSKGAVPAGLRSIVYGGGPMYVEELVKDIAVLGPVFSQIYGQGESPMTITGLRREDHLTADSRILGSVGVPRTGVQLRVVDSNDNPLPAGEIGEIVCRGDVVMSGYWGSPAATAETLRNGWLHTGDMGTFDERGYLTLRDRSKDVVISGGTNIYPREIEELLLTHPAVQEVSVLGQRDDEWGEIVVAFVVPEVERQITAEELDAHCLSSIARFKRPKQYYFVTSLPKNSYGKVLKRELKEMLDSGHVQ